MNVPRSSSPPPALRIVIVAPDLAPDGADPEAGTEAERSRLLRIGLLENGYNIVAVLPVDVFLPDRLAQIGPDMIIVDAESQARDTLEHVVMATRDARRPIVLFTEDEDTSHVRRRHRRGRHGLRGGRPRHRPRQARARRGHGALSA